MSRVWIDGRLLPPGEATVAAVTPGVQVGFGVFEALAVIDGEAFALSRHLRRLAASADLLRIAVEVPDATLRAAVGAVIAANPGANKVRITVSATGDRSSTVVVNAITQSAWPATAQVIVSPWVRNERAPSVGAKTTSYVDNRLAQLAAQRQGADEALLFDTSGHLSEGTASNVFLEIDGRLCTPSLGNGGLGGMTRELLCEVVDVQVRDDISLGQLRAAAEVFITSSTRGVHPVESIDGTRVAQCPGPLTSAAAEAYAALRSQGLDP